MPNDQSRPTELPQKFRRSRSIDPASPNACISGSTEFHHSHAGRPADLSTTIQSPRMRNSQGRAPSRSQKLMAEAK